MQVIEYQAGGMSGWEVKKESTAELFSANVMANIRAIDADNRAMINGCSLKAKMKMERHPRFAEYQEYLERFHKRNDGGFDGCTFYSPWTFEQYIA